VAPVSLAESADVPPGLEHPGAWAARPRVRQVPGEALVVAAAPDSIPLN